MEQIQHASCQVNGITLHYVIAGKGPLLILLHGFPQYWYTWRHQIPVLAEHFTVVAPDLRGYGESEKPLKIDEYTTKTISKDITGLIGELGFEKAHIVGHDFGGAVAWKIAQLEPDRVDHLVVLNCPHPYIFAKALRSNFTQIRKSWYIFFFQLPYLPEWMVQRGGRKFVSKLLRSSSKRKDTFTNEDIDNYTRALQIPGVLTAAFNYYRAAFRCKPSTEELKKKISAPTLLIWGEEDQALGRELTLGMEPLFTGPFKIEYIPQCGHFVNEEEPEKVNAHLLNFLQTKGHHANECLS